MADVLPVPEPTPRPTRLAFLVAPGLSDWFNFIFTPSRYALVWYAAIKIITIAQPNKMLDLIDHAAH